MMQALRELSERQQRLLDDSFRRLREQRAQQEPRAALVAGSARCQSLARSHACTGTRIHTGDAVLRRGSAPGGDRKRRQRCGRTAGTAR